MELHKVTEPKWHEIALSSPSLIYDWYSFPDNFKKYRWIPLTANSVIRILDYFELKTISLGFVIYYQLSPNSRYSKLFNTSPDSSKQRVQMYSKFSDISEWTASIRGIRQFREIALSSPCLIYNIQF